MAIETACGALEAQGIPVAVLKGPHVAVTLYADPHERSWTDLDLLVSPAHFQDALGTLARAGCKVAPLSRTRRYTDRTTYCRELRSPLGLPIELHRALAPHGLYPTDIDGILQRRTPFRFQHVHAYGPNPEDLALCLIIHLIKTCYWAQPKHFVDLARILQKPDLVWQDLWANLRTAGAQTGTWMAMQVLMHAYRVPMPEPWKQSACPPRWRRTWLGFFLDPTQPLPYRFSNHSPSGIALRLRLPLLDRLRDWPRFLARYAFARLADIVLQIPGRYNNGHV